MRSHVLDQRTSTNCRYERHSLKLHLAKLADESWSHLTTYPRPISPAGGFLGTWNADGPVELAFSRNAGKGFENTWIPTVHGRVWSIRLQSCPN
jgi:hypothetical protein